MLAFLTIIIKVFPIICAEQPESKLIRQLNDFFKFDHNIYLLEASTIINRFIDITEQPLNVPQSLYIFNSSDLDVAVVNQTKGKNSLLIVVPDSVGSSLILVKRIREGRLQINVKIGVFFQETASSDDLRTLFQLCWTNLIINIFAASYYEDSKVLNTERVIHIFTYNPFGTFDVIDLTGSKNYDVFFLRQNSNFQNYTLQLAEHVNTLFPRLSDKELWHAIIRVMNASFERFPRNGSYEKYGSVFYIIPTVRKYKPPNMYMYMTTTMIMVPEALPYSEFSAYLVIMTSDEFFGYTLIAIVGLMLFLTFIRYIKQNKILLFQSIADVSNLLINDNVYIDYRQLTRVEVFIIVPLTFVGMVIVNGILSNLQSYLTRPIPQPQINTIDDLHKSGLLMYTYDYYYANLSYNVLSNLSPHLDWTNRFFQAEDVTALYHEIMSFNRSFAFIEDLRYAKNLLKPQKRLNVRGYHIPQFYIYNYVCSYEVHPDFPFLERLNEIVHWVRNAGLYDLWWRIDYAGYNKEVLKYYVKRFSTRKEIDINRFPLPLLVVYGWCGSVIVFAIEIIWKKLKFSQLKGASKIKNRVSKKNWN